MATLFYICLLVGGLFAVSDYFSGKGEKVKSFVDKILPAQGIIGIILAVFAIINLIDSFKLLKIGFKFWFFYFYIILIALLLAFLLCFKLISKLFLSKNEEAKAKAEKIVEKIQAWQTPLGWICASNGLLFLLMPGF